MKVYKKIKSLSTKSLLLVLGVVIGAGVSVVYAASWSKHTKLNKAIDDERVLNVNDMKELKADLDYLKANMTSTGTIITQSDCYYTHNTNTDKPYCNNGYVMVGWKDQSGGENWGWTCCKLKVGGSHNDNFSLNGACGSSKYSCNKGSVVWKSGNAWECGDNAPGVGCAIAQEDHD